MPRSIMLALAALFLAWLGAIAVLLCFLAALVGVPWLVGATVLLIGAYPIVGAIVLVTNTRPAVSPPPSPLALAGGRHFGRRRADGDLMSKISSLVEEEAAKQPINPRTPDWALDLMPNEESQV